MKKTISIIAIMFFTISLFGQKEQEKNVQEKPAKSTSNWLMIGTAKYVTQHYWRGIGKGGLFGKSPSFEPNIVFTNGKISVGLIGAASFDNIYKCMLPWVTYSPVKGLKIGIWDIYSPGTDFWKTNIFDFDLSSSKHFVDATLEYKFPFNLGVKWATLIAGGDPNPTNRDKRNFTSYFEVNYAYAWNRFSVAAAVGITPWKGLYYSKKAGFNNLEATLKYKLPIYQKVSLPIWATCAYNPIADYFQFLAGASIVIPYKL